MFPNMICDMSDPCQHDLQHVSVDSWTTVPESECLGFSPMPKHGSSLAMASLNFGWETAQTIGFMHDAVLATNENKFWVG